MRSTFRLTVCAVALSLSIGMVSAVQAAIIDLQVTLHIVNVTGATTMGTSAQQQSILNVVNNIWSQAGIQVAFKDFTSWTDSNALNGGYSSVTGLMNAGKAAGVVDPDPFVLNVFMVNARPNESPGPGPSSSAGVAGLGWNGMAFFIGSNLMGWGSWQTIGYVLAHEIGHNLNLPHPDDYGNPLAVGGPAYDNLTNLMYSGTLPGISNNASRNVVLTPEQIAIARASVFAAPIPEPATMVMLVIGGLWLNRHRRAA